MPPKSKPLHSTKSTKGSAKKASARKPAVLAGGNPRVAKADGDMKKSGWTEGQSASELIDTRIAELGDWRGQTLSRMRKLIKEADPDVVEEVKWVKSTNPGGVPTWSHDGIICTGESYKSTVRALESNAQEI